MRQLHFRRPIGAGAFGTVYLAELRSGKGFQRPVAVKVLQDTPPDSAAFMARIRDEARLLGLLQDDAILKVLELTQVEGQDAVIMEYVEGVDLDTLIDAKTVPPSRGLVQLGAQVAGALAGAHSACHPTTGQPLNVIHRDVKPANIMLTRNGGVRLLDFGVARAKFDARESSTGQLVLGTLNYMAPE
ncbi:MAG: serine/threonine-protein kinase, partial [Myxococcota bacterium]|nr:serine/threonine-protein kinase [Myxococcota bacterium]